MMRRVWSALLSNARTATLGRADARIEISTELEAGRAIYRIGDNGVGFDMAYAGKLFGVFQKLHRAGVFPGNGAGLAMVARIMRRHDGSVWADARVDAGATFTFALPRRSAA
jgi:chemotaxis family two-component system sensor kinase Cph1